MTSKQRSAQPAGRISFRETAYVLIFVLKAKRLNHILMQGVRTAICSLVEVENNRSINVLNVLEANKRIGKP